MTKQEVLEACINKQLESYDIGYDEVKKGGRYENHYVIYLYKKKYLWGLINLDKSSKQVTPWYQHYTFNSKEEYESWKEFCINLFRKELKMSKEVAEEQFMWLDLNYGLKQNYEVKI